MKLTHKHLKNYQGAMTDYKKQAALGALRFLRSDMIIGVGMGSTINNLLVAIAADTSLSENLTLVSACAETDLHIKHYGLKLADAADFKEIDLYFDGCDQLDSHLNAFKSGGGIHVSEKILATMAKEFILLADSGKFVPVLNNVYPVIAGPTGIQLIS